MVKAHTDETGNERMPRKGALSVPPNTRTVHDSLGTLQVPADAYYGAQTARAMYNFPISGLHFPHQFIQAQALIKWAAAKAHRELGVMQGLVSDAICQAADEVIAGRFSNWFPIDIYQAGAGTSQNMNVNEVIATRATEILRNSGATGDDIHPNDHVNQSQSTNDTFHAAINIAGVDALATQLDPSLAELEKALARLATETENVIKSGRTHLQDAVPMRLGDEFLGYAENIRRQRRWLEQAASQLLFLGLGGNAVGTGINTPPGFGGLAIHFLAQRTGYAFTLAPNAFTFNQNPDEVVYVSGVLRSVAGALGRIANDLRLLSSGPRTGLGELEFPAVQPGSSIMPGKVNPVLAEMLNMVVFQVNGCCQTVSDAGGAGQLELNVMMPVMVSNFLHAIHILANATRQFSRLALQDLHINVTACRQHAETSLSLATALNTAIGYESAAKVVKHALENHLSLLDACRQLGVEEATAVRALDVDHLARPVSQHWPPFESKQTSVPMSGSGTGAQEPLGSPIVGLAASTRPKQTATEGND